MSNKRLDLLFPVPVASVLLEEFDSSKYISYCETEVEWRQANPGNSPRAYQSSDLSVLEKFPELKALLYAEVSEYIKEALLCSSTDFVITTSWFTKTDPDGYSEFHRHSNSWISGCLYFENDKDFGKFTVTSDNHVSRSGLMVQPDIWSTTNCQVVEYESEEGRLLLFPSNILHRVATHSSNKPRYSLAFNTFPVGKIGYADSQVVLEVKPTNYVLDND